MAKKKTRSARDSRSKRSSKKKRPKKKLTTQEIEALYDKIPRLTQERNDFLLPQVVYMVEEEKWIRLRPEYQRRLVWDSTKKSRFIESLLMNIPVPPIFLYEHALNRYEVMDGQQRLNTILEFYNDELTLSGLKRWTVLNGKRYSDCPKMIARGLDRRRVSATVLLAESAKTKSEMRKLRKEVFERLNTGGEKLNAQEIRNALYDGPFNDLLIELAGLDSFDDIWGIPRYSDHYDHKSGRISDQLKSNKLFSRMKDCEIVLRFFALRDTDSIRGSIKSILTRCMVDNQRATDEYLDECREDFTRSLGFAHRIFGDHAFKVRTETGAIRMSEPLFDGVMIAIDRLDDQSIRRLVKRSARLTSELDKLTNDPDTYSVIVGKPNTAKAVCARIELIHKLFSKVAQ